MEIGLQKAREEGTAAACAAKSGRFESPAKKDPEAIGFGVFRTGSYFA